MLHVVMWSETHPLIIQSFYTHNVSVKKIEGFKKRILHAREHCLVRLTFLHEEN